MTLNSKYSHRDSALLTNVRQAAILDSCDPHSNTMILLFLTAVKLLLLVLDFYFIITQLFIDPELTAT